MPRGIPSGIKMHCKRCQDTPGFKSVSELRKHQWSEHREYYAAVTKRSLKKARIAKALKREQRNGNQDLPLEISAVPVAVKQFFPAHEMTVSEAIRSLETRCMFMSDVISLLKGLQNGG